MRRGVDLDLSGVEYHVAAGREIEGVDLFVGLHGQLKIFAVGRYAPYRGLTATVGEEIYLATLLGPTCVVVFEIAFGYLDGLALAHGLDPQVGVALVVVHVIDGDAVKGLSAVRRETGIAQTLHLEHYLGSEDAGLLFGLRKTGYV